MATGGIRGSPRAEAKGPSPLPEVGKVKGRRCLRLSQLGASRQSSQGPGPPQSGLQPPQGVDPGSAQPGALHTAEPPWDSPGLRQLLRPGELALPAEQAVRLTAAPAGQQCQPRVLCPVPTGVGRGRSPSPRPPLSSVLPCRAAWRRHNGRLSDARLSDGRAWVTQPLPTLPTITTARTLPLGPRPPTELQPGGPAQSPAGRGGRCSYAHLPGAHGSLTQTPFYILCDPTNRRRGGVLPRAVHLGSPEPLARLQPPRQ